MNNSIVCYLKLGLLTIGILCLFITANVASACPWWYPYDPISVGDINSPHDGFAYGINTEVQCSIASGSDIDLRYVPPSTYTEEADTLTYIWTKTDGSWKNGISEGTQVVWIAPDHPSNGVTITCTIHDAAIISDGGGGSRDDPDVQRSVTVKVIGGSLNGSDGQIVHYECGRLARDSATFSAQAGQPTGTTYHWTLSNSNIAKFRVTIDGVNYLYTTLDGGYPNVTVVAVDARSYQTHDVTVSLEYKYTNPDASVTTSQATNTKDLDSMTTSSISVVSQTGPYQITGGWQMETLMQVRDQCGCAYQSSAWVAEYRQTPWCIDGFGSNKPTTSSGDTDSTGQWTDYTWITGTWDPGWCAKASQYWRAGACSTSDLWFCQQWFPATVAHTQKNGCAICNACTQE